MALGRLGVPVSFLGRISEDPFGHMLTRALEQSGVDLSLCPRTQALSTLGFIIFECGQKKPSYVFYTERTAGCALEIGDVSARLPTDTRMLHFGSFSLAVDPIGTALEKLLSLKTPQTLVSVDPNIRPFLIHNRQLFIPRLNQFLEKADLIKLSEEDLQWLHPGMSPRSCCEHYLQLGAGLVAVTRGAQGVVAMNPQGYIEMSASAVSVVYTVGAGDAFQAAMLAWMYWEYGAKPQALKQLGQEELFELLKFATQVAAITCSRAGCNPPWHHELPVPDGS